MSAPWACWASASPPPPLSGLLGLSPALGAFLGGLAVGHSTLRRGALTMAQPVQSILLFVFFLSVGLLIDLQLSDRADLGDPGALVVVTGGKTFLNWLLLMLAGESLRHRRGSFAVPVAGGGILLRHRQRRAWRWAS